MLGIASLEAMLKACLRSQVDYSLIKWHGLVIVCFAASAKAITAHPMLVKTSKPGIVASCYCILK
jgi:hypothetical protein